MQNAGDEDTGVVVFFWREHSGLCPPTDPGPVGSACMWVVENGVWSIVSPVIPSTARSAIAYSVDGTLFDDACEDAADAVGDGVAWRDWEDDYEDTGEPIAVIAQRKGPNEYDTVVSSTYPGISEVMEGSGPPFQYFAPYAMRQYHGLDTEIIIHNSGQRCTSVWLDYQEQNACTFSYSESIGQLAPGESTRKRVPEVLGANGWLGSIYITANEPLGIVMDQTSFLPSEDQGTLLTYEARPYKLTTDTLFYADLIWRELSGWSSSIQVQNLTQSSQPTFVTVEFFDSSDDSILFLGEWVCRAGGTTFYLPAITSLGMEYAGAAVIQSHSQVGYPGDSLDGQPIFAVVDLKKTKVYDESLPGWRHTMTGEIQGGSYNAIAESENEGDSTIMLPFLAKTMAYEGVTSLIAVRNNSNCNDVEVKLEIRKGTGTIVSYVTDFWLPAGHVNLIDLADVGTVSPGFVGAGTIEVMDMRQLCDTDHDGQEDQTPPMISAVVVNEGAGPGDVTEIYEGIPFDYHGSPCLVTVSGHVIDELTLDPINGADVNGVSTDLSGYYGFQVSSDTWGVAFTLDVTKDGYEPWSADYTLCCDDLALVINPELYPECDSVTVTGHVEDKETGLPVVGATVWAFNTAGDVETITDDAGLYSLELAYAKDSTTWVAVSADGYNGSADGVFIPICDVAQVDFQLHQTPKSRILLYWGNGGEAVSGTDYDIARALFENLGYFVDYTSDWPTDPDLEEYKVIFLLGPGDANGDPANDDFTPGQVAQLDLFLRNGGRLVVMAEAGGSVDVEDNLIAALNALGLTFNGATITGALVSDPTPDQITTDVDTLDFDTATSIAVGAGAAPGELGDLDAPHPSAGAVIIAADTMPGITRGGTGGWGSGFAGDVVLIGDLDWMDDASFMGYVTQNGYYWPDWPADNENLLLNIIGF